MGLSAPRKRTKISHDPNNTNWSRSTSGFGHKIMSSQGWTPGSFLGARDAAHADMFTAGSASHIKVTLKDDTLGLGARPGRDLLGEPTGLDAFKGLLGRLNGKSDAELEADQQKRDEIKVAQYTATKWQTVRFISGGLLAQEKPSALDAEKSSSDKSAADDTEREDKSDRQEKKKKKKSRRCEADEGLSKSEKRAKKDKKRKQLEDIDNKDDSLDKGTSDSNSVSTASRGEPKDSSSSDVKPISRERRPVGRQIFRSRHIQQKKRAVMDDKSLNEIFMIKS
ncbi:hypothetical protein P168DRAFT_293138 [Aspergillus campestris IBT 28561]|uniref:Protein PXR1 n=1 Tax=Aspergillus campestris (strain IBT 28561) TaxID=1392248 RepID=A0A2I1CUN5_ASPC2|nr:uncharacterized protein P168DRAFT_293138 [Aspergillus campestris IBT 28561]PKY01325.1 hypothetical protein P168DRAFT_293138 [Aspergillus campestris IBT 28561]